MGRSTVTFSPDTIQEFKVLTSTYSARYGSTGGGIVSTVSKSGTNQVHGNAFWFHRNPKVAARTYNSTVPPGLRRHEFGTTVGGPVRVPKVYDGRSKTFYFFSFEPKRRMDAMDWYYRVPTAAERQGDFRNMWVAPGQAVPLLYRQVQCFPSEADCQQFKALNRTTSSTVYPLFSADDPDPTKRGHVIPTQYLDPLAMKLISQLPMPNMPYDAKGKNYYGRRGVVGRENRWNLKMDHSVSSANRFTVRYTEAPNYADRFGMARDTSAGMAYTGDSGVNRQAFLSDTHTISPRMVNEFRASYTNSDFSSMPPEAWSKTSGAREMGLSGIGDFGYPEFSMAGWGDEFMGLSPTANIGRFLEHQYQFSDDLTMMLGKHTVTVGTDWRFQQMNIKGRGLGDACCGLYTFYGQPTLSGNSSIPTGSGGERFAAFELGIPYQIGLRGVTIPYYYRFRVGAFYVEDDIKVRSNLTINAGLRWQYNSPRAEKYNRQASVDLDHPVALMDSQGRLTGRTLNYQFTGFDGSRYLEPAYKRNFEPRLGFAWTPRHSWNRDKRFVVRGGYGMSHLPATGRARNPLPDFGAGDSTSWTYVGWTGTGNAPRTQSKQPEYLIRIGSNPPVVSANPVMSEIPKDGKLCIGCSPRDPRVPGGASITGLPGANQTYWVSNAASPYIQNWNLTTQVQLKRRLVLSLTYLGQKGTHLYSPVYNMNTPNVAEYQDMIRSGIDPEEFVPDPSGRVDSRGNVLNIRRKESLAPFPGLGAIMVAGRTGSSSIYHAGVAEIERRFAGWMGFRFNYTWGKSIDDASAGFLDTVASAGVAKGYFQDPFNSKMNRSVSYYDSRHRLNLTWTSNLPFGRRHKLSGGKYVDAAISNWSLNAIGSIYSGSPVLMFLGTDNGIPGGYDQPQAVRPDMVPGVPVKNPLWTKSASHSVPYWNPAAFAVPAFGTLGNAPRTLDYARQPWNPNLNLSLTRDFKPFKNEQRRLQLRADAMSVMNHPVFRSNQATRLLSRQPLTASGQPVTGPFPYVYLATFSQYPVGSREYILGQASNGQGFLLTEGAGGNRTIQFALKLFF